MVSFLILNNLNYCHLLVSCKFLKLVVLHDKLSPSHWLVLRHWGTICCRLTGGKTGSISFILSPCLWITRFWQRVTVTMIWLGDFSPISSLHPKKNLTAWPFNHFLDNPFQLQIFWKLQEKEKLLVTRDFSSSHSVFYPSGELSAIFIQYEIVVCKLFQFGRA